MQKRDYFCPSCRKIVGDIRAESGFGWMIETSSQIPYLCQKCGTRVIQLTRSDGKTRKDV